jgi:hypothetical protein
MRTTRCRGKNYTRRLFFQTIVRTSCTHKFCVLSNLCIKIILQKFIVHSYTLKLCV